MSVFVEQLNSPNKNTSPFRQWLKRKLPLVMVLLLVTTLIVVFFWQRIVITIQPGEAGILFRRFSGTEIDKIYDEGLHIFSPLDTVYIYEVRNQLALHDFKVISNKGLTVNLSLAIRYRPEYDLLGILHQQIGPDYLQRVIIPQIESVMRKRLGQYTAEQIYTNEAGLLTNTILVALDEVGRNYVEVEDIIIRAIDLPKDMVTAIEDKLKQEELMKSYEFRLKTAEKEAQRLKIEATGLRDYHSTLDEALTEKTLRLKGIEATESLAASNNAKIVIIGSGKDGLPIILNTDTAITPNSSTTKEGPLSPQDQNTLLSPKTQKNGE
jgi:regulator of protease activity HflC (stomatin/prohibitin superfamily)